MHSELSHDDFRDAIEYIHSKHPEDKLYAYGNSTGATIINLYMNEVSLNNEEIILSGVVCLNPIFDKMESSAYFDNYAYGYVSKFVADGYKRGVLQQKHMMRLMEKEYGIDFEDVYSDNCTNSHDFIDKFLSKMFGCADAFEYYEAVKLVDKIQNLKVKTLFISSKDDILCGCQIPKEEIEQNENTYLMVTHSGSHLAFYDKLFSSKQWFMIPTFKFINYLHSQECEKSSV